MSRFSPGVFATKSPRGGRRSALGLATLVCSLAILAVVVSGASAGKVPSTQVVLGQTSTVPDPSCPGLPCQAVGSVTGFQVSNSQARSPFLVTHKGTIKSWSLTLAQPTNKQRSFFNGFFGTPPEARLAILRRVPGTNPPRYNLRSQSAVKVLTPYLGQTVKFGTSLKVEKNDIVGITVPTWAPSFAQELPSNEVWRASREPGTCTNSTDIRQGEPLEKIGTRATFGCRYSTARLLYTATLVEG
ncbi:MAG TPA: hypothetical protein VGO13_00515 [Solirubrobacterales bacterium]|jgi:hypothetical protein|nr:hypothetical protein [Solirubrobacterales bacterium]